MDLITHIKGAGGTGTIDCPVVRSIATAAGCSHRTLYMIAKGHKKPGPKLTRRLALATGMKSADIRPDYFGPADHGQAA